MEGIWLELDLVAQETSAISHCLTEEMFLTKQKWRRQALLITALSSDAGGIPKPAQESQSAR